MLQNTRVIAFTISELLRDNQQRGTTSPQIRVNFLNLLSVFFFEILCSKRGQKLHEDFTSFLRKNLIWGNVIFLGYFLHSDWVWSKLFLSWILLDHVTVRTWLRSLNGQDMIFQVNVYMIDIVWILCDV